MENRSLCWNITERCNENCKYCYRLTGYEERTLEENLKILEMISKTEIKNLSWAGGEALLYPGIIKLLEKTKEYGIRNKLITNGKVLDKELIDKLATVLDELTISFDSTIDDIHGIIGRGENQGRHVIEILEYIKEKDYKFLVKINTVVNKLNIDNIEEIYNVLSQYNIYRWKLFKFQPLRGNAIKNRKMFDISDEEYEKIVSKIVDKAPKMKIIIVNKSEIENSYLLISPAGDFMVTDDFNDKILCEYAYLNTKNIKEIVEKYNGI